MKKTKKTLKIILISGLIGFVLSFLIHNGYWNKLILGFKSVNYFSLLLIVITFFLTILIHELGHLFTFLIKGIKIRALYVLIFILKNTDKGWKFQIYPKLIQILGGMVVPDIPVIDNDEDYLKVVEGFSKSLIMGPITSILFLIIVLILFFFFWIFTTNYLLIGIFTITSITLTILTILVIISSKVKTDMFYGDFVAYDKMQNDELFQLYQITQYIGFSLNDHSETNVYLKRKIEKYFIENGIKYEVFNISLLMHYITLFINGEYIENKKITSMIENLSIYKLIRNEKYREAAFLISAYYYKIKKVSKSYETFELIKSYNIINKNDIIIKQYEHMLNIKDNTKLLKNASDEYYGQIWILKPLFSKEELVSDLLYKLEYQEYKTNILTYL